MARDRTYEVRGESDDRNRAAIGVFLRLTKNQVDELERLAGTVPLADYLREIAEAAIERLIPPNP